ncbi:hypothetical protein AVEN_40851-1 [Araneus ventricosus]|uniref:Uncharacterized protein n=1 Tax=Araneus ventricosus TaxID=182803 RepID=A0A4Y2MD06_ARAVE|nr:hypothetical protein AVEN_40851-1 [Araneus ventricosus]
MRNLSKQPLDATASSDLDSGFLTFTKTQALWTHDPQRSIPRLLDSVLRKYIDAGLSKIVSFTSLSFYVDTHFLMFYTIQGSRVVVPSGKGMLSDLEGSGVENYSLKICL